MRPTNVNGGVPRRILLSIVAMLLCIAIAGCGGGGGGAVGGAVGRSVSMTGGVIHGGRQPIAGSKVTVWTPGLTGYGSAPTSLATTTTDAHGQWGVDFNCPTDASQIYVTAQGGNGGFGVNPAISLMAMMGPCGKLSSFAFINEVTTIGSIYALAQFSNPTTPIDIGTPSKNIVGLNNASAMVANLVNVTTGKVATGLPSYLTTPAATTNTLANILAACVDSAAPSFTQCTTLFNGAQPPGLPKPTDTLGAALNLALNPALTLSALYNLAQHNYPFAPSLASAPTNWLLCLFYLIYYSSPASHTGLGLNDLAIDPQGNVWYSGTRYGGTAAIGVMSPTGVILSPFAGYTGGGMSVDGLNPLRLAIDERGLVWVMDYKQMSEFCGAETANCPPGFKTGQPISPSTGYSQGNGIHYLSQYGVNFLIGGNGFVWAPNPQDPSVTVLCGSDPSLCPDGLKTGEPISPFSFDRDTNGYPVDICEHINSVAFDPLGLLWITSEQGPCGIGEVCGSEVANCPEGAAMGDTISPGGGYLGSHSNRNVVDNLGIIWWVDSNPQTAVPQPAATCGAIPKNCPSGKQVTGELLTHYRGGYTIPLGFSGFSVDGNGNLWGQTGSGNNPYPESGYFLGELCGMTTANCPSGVQTGQMISPATGGYGPIPYGGPPMIDQSGNIWGSGGIPAGYPSIGGTIAEIVGVAKPVRTPLVCNSIPTAPGC